MACAISCMLSLFHLISFPAANQVVMSAFAGNSHTFSFLETCNSATGHRWPRGIQGGLVITLCNVRTIITDLLYTLKCDVRQVGLAWASPWGGRLRLT